MHRAVYSWPAIAIDGLRFVPRIKAGVLSHGRLELSHGRLKSARCALQTRCKGITPGVKATRDRETPSPSSALAVSPRPSRRAIRALAPSRAQRPFLVRPRGLRGGRRLQISTRFQTSIHKSKQNGQAMGAGRRGFTSLSPPRAAPTPRPTSERRRYQAATLSHCAAFWLRITPPRTCSGAMWETGRTSMVWNTPHPCAAHTPYWNAIVNDIACHIRPAV